ncbi:hypothetical protein ACI48D_00265 [Massilia sp. LXY-6]|uniref:hypothetical protein n=1 Tax=Massilia sp. LXY-6 TaxID=3379823 RepID=UPI003EE003C8
MAGTLLRCSGRLLYLITILAGGVYALSCIVWLRAPVLSVLLLSTLMALPFLGLAWLLERIGERMSKRKKLPWFHVDPDNGIMHRTERK